MKGGLSRPHPEESTLPGQSHTRGSVQPMSHSERRGVDALAQTAKQPTEGLCPEACGTYNVFFLRPELCPLKGPNSHKAAHSPGSDPLKLMQGSNGQLWFGKPALEKRSLHIRSNSKGPLSECHNAPYTCGFNYLPHSD